VICFVTVHNWQRITTQEVRQSRKLKIASSYFTCLSHFVNRRA
jgi:hypothetical protein